MSPHVTNVEEPVFDTCSPEELEIETNTITDDSLYFLETALADDCEEEAWEELFEDDENVEEVTDGSHQENPLGAGEEKPLYHGARITLGVSLLLIITFVMRHQLSGTALKGVKGLSWFLYVPGFNIIRGITIDYVHGTLLGVVKC